MCTKLQEMTISFVMSVSLSIRLHWNNPAPAGWIFMKFDI
jgi:hypothetical protein